MWLIVPNYLISELRWIFITFVETHRKDMEGALIEYYTEKDRRHLTYLDIMQQICSNRTRACPGGTHTDTKTEDKKVILFMYENMTMDLKSVGNIQKEERMSFKKWRFRFPFIHYIYL